MTEKEVRPRIELAPTEREATLMRVVDEILRGETADDAPEIETEGEGAFSGVLLDLNDVTLLDQEKKDLLAWIEDLLGCPLGEAPIRARLATGNGMSEVIIYQADLGEGEMAEDWRIARMRNDGEMPSYVMMSAEVWDDNLRSGVYRLVEWSI